jgi:L-fuculose-phosphate aldolase
VVQVCRLLYAKNLISAVDGNVSVRLSEGLLLTTPSGVSKGLLRPEELVVTDLSGQMVSVGADPSVGPSLRPSSELRMHLEIYRQRADAQAVVHAHPPLATALTVAGVSLAPCLLPETLVNLGTIVTAPYATPTTAQVPLAIRDLVPDHDALLLDRHGAVTMGSSLLDAYTKMEKVENAAQVLTTARLLGRVRPLPLEEIRRLSAKRDGLLAPARRFPGPDCARCGACAGVGDM